MPGRPSPSVQRTAGGVTVGINVGIAEVGITTDYGGGGKIGFGGQSVTWGLEGGRIQMGIAGFELTVEARNCVVTEVKKIAGQVVSTRTYPDPGCKDKEEKKPKEEEKKPTPENLTPEGDDGTNRLGEGWAWVVVHEVSEASGFEKRRNFAGAPWLNDYSYYSKRTHIITRNGPINISGGRLDLSVFSAESIYLRRIENRATPPPITGTGTMITRQNRFSDTGSAQGIIAYSFWRNDSIERQEDPPNFFRDSFPVLSIGVASVFYGQQQVIKAYISAYNARPEYNQNINQTFPLEERRRVARRRAVVGEIIPLNSPPPPPPPPPPGGNRPPMNSQCCKEILADLADLKDVLAVREIKAKKVSIPGELIKTIAEGEAEPPDELILNYAQMGNATLLAINKYGIHTPLTAEIEDANLIQKGKQPDSITYNSPGMAIKAILDDLLEIKAQNNARLEIQVRLAYTCTRILKIVAGIGESLAGLIKVFGFPFRKNNPKSLSLEFNLPAAKKGGYGKQVKGKEKTPSPEELGQMLSDLLQTTTYELPAPSFDPNDDDVRELLVKILLSVQK